MTSGRVLRPMRGSNRGKALPGVIIAVERRRRITPGRFVRFLERLSGEDAPFAGAVRYLTPDEG